MSFELDVMPTKTKIAAGLFILAFCLKFVGLLFGTSPHRWVGYSAFGLAFSCLIVSCVLCIIQMRSYEKPPSLQEVQKWMKHYNLGNSK